MEKKFIFGLVTAMAFIGLVGSAAETPLAAKAATGDPAPSWTYDEDQDQSSATSRPISRLPRIARTEPSTATARSPKSKTGQSASRSG